MDVDAKQPPLAAPALPPGQRYLDSIAEFFDRFAPDEPGWRLRNRTYHELVASIHRFFVPPGASVLEIGCGSGDLLSDLRPSRAVGIDVSPAMIDLARSRHPEIEFAVEAGERYVRDDRFDYVVLSDLVPFAFDLQALLHNVREMTHDRSRIVIHSYSQLWRPIIRVAELLRLKPRKPIRNWVTPNDVRNLLELAEFDVVSTSRRVLFPKRVPFLSTFLNGIVANIWPLSHLALTWWVVARPRPASRDDLSVSIIVPCLNERGMIEEIIERTPDLGRGTELVFVEGGSTDGTREEIEQQITAHPERRISLHVQQGKGKGDAVRLGFERAENELLMILDADLTVEPEELPKFYRAVADGHADFVNGSRLVYDLEAGAMQFLNLVGNKFFASAFSAIIGQPVKDTLCGTKVLRRSDYESIARARSYFGEFDPFGDFDLLLGAGRLALKIVDVPIRYRARRYGSTNISRFRHGLALLQMSAFAFWKFRVEPYRSSASSRASRAQEPKGG